MRKKHPGAVALGKLRAATMTPEERRAFARLGGLAVAGKPRKRRKPIAA